MIGCWLDLGLETSDTHFTHHIDRGPGFKQHFPAIFLIPFYQNSLPDKLKIKFQCRIEQQIRIHVLEVYTSKLSNMLCNKSTSLKLEYLILINTN